MGTNRRNRESGLEIDGKLADGAGRRRRAGFRDYLRIARPDHWIKNLFIYPGLFLALVVLRPDLSLVFEAKAIVAFFATSLVASANYVINEWLDAKFDRFHPVKKNRPVVQSALNPAFVYAEYGVLAAAGLALSFSISRPFGFCAAWLFLMGVVYNVEPFRTKDVPYLDVLSESINNMIRLLMGWFIVKAEPAVYVLKKQVEEMTSGAVSGGMLETSLSLGVAASVGLSMIRVLTGLNILWFLLPRNTREISFSASMNGPSTTTST